MECDSDLIFFLLERAKCLVLKYIKEFDWKSFLRATQVLEHKAPKNYSVTLVTFVLSKNICLSFFYYQLSSTIYMRLLITMKALIWY